MALQQSTILEFDWQNLLQVLLYLAAAVLILAGCTCSGINRAGR